MNAPREKIYNGKSREQLVKEALHIITTPEYCIDPQKKEQWRNRCNTATQETDAALQWILTTKTNRYNNQNFLGKTSCQRNSRRLLGKSHRFRKRKLHKSSFRKNAIRKQSRKNKTSPSQTLKQQQRGKMRVELIRNYKDIDKPKASARIQQKMTKNQEKTHSRKPWYPRKRKNKSGSSAENIQQTNRKWPTKKCRYLDTPNRTSQYEGPAGEQYFQKRFNKATQNKNVDRKNIKRNHRKKQPGWDGNKRLIRKLKKLKKENKKKRNRNNNYSKHM